MFLDVHGKLLLMKACLAQSQHMQCLGPLWCLCYTSTIKRDETKLDTETHLCVFIDYSHSQTTYKVYDLTNIYFLRSVLVATFVWVWELRKVIDLHCR